MAERIINYIQKPIIINSETESLPPSRKRVASSPKQPRKRLAKKSASPPFPPTDTAFAANSPLPAADLTRGEPSRQRKPSQRGRESRQQEE